MNTEHTPDVWYVDEGAERAEIKDENGFYVATAHDFDEARDIVREHNAHSVMLAALQEFVTDCDAVGEENVAQEWPDWIPTLRKARAAIAKATEG